MTFIADLCVEVSIENLKNNFKSPAFPVCSFKKTKNHHEYETTKRGKKKLSFYNQITINYSDHTTKSIKIFSNGRLQMTGITSLNEAKKSAEIISDIIKAVDPKIKEIIPSKFQIALINSNFSFKNSLNIIKLRHYITDCKIEYKPDVYPGLKIKHNETNASIFLFSTGNVVITGVKSLKSIQKAFEHITKNVLDCYSEIKLPVNNTPKLKKQILYKDGYQFPQYNACLS
jgi:TATA-box binding protein (TBP) (component of TFIID and TFIIIB)